MEVLREVIKKYRKKGWDDDKLAKHLIKMSKGEVFDGEIAALYRQQMDLRKANLAFRGLKEKSADPNAVSIWYR